MYIVRSTENSPKPKRTISRPPHSYKKRKNETISARNDEVLDSHLSVSISAIEMFKHKYF